MPKVSKSGMSKMKIPSAVVLPEVMEHLEALKCRVGSYGKAIGFLMELYIDISSIKDQDDYIDLVYMEAMQKESDFRKSRSLVWGVRKIDKEKETLHVRPIRSKAKPKMPSMPGKRNSKES